MWWHTESLTKTFLPLNAILYNMILPLPGMYFPLDLFVNVEAASSRHLQIWEQLTALSISGFSDSYRTDLEYWTQSCRGLLRLSFMNRVKKLPHWLWKAALPPYSRIRFHIVSSHGTNRGESWAFWVRPFPSLQTPQRALERRVQRKAALLGLWRKTWFSAWLLHIRGKS